MKYAVQYTKTICGEVEVEATSREEAENLARDAVYKDVNETTAYDWTREVSINSVEEHKI